MGIDTLKRAVFLDRDGVLNANVLNPATGQWESPHHPKDFQLYPWVPDALRRLQQSGYVLFVVSNQPSYAKGKTSLENIQAVADCLKAEMDQHGIAITAYYYCLHHPEGKMPDYSFRCSCRKPEPYFLHKAATDYSLDLNASWMIGDRATDIQCGQRAGTQTILIKPDHALNRPVDAVPDYVADTLQQAVDLILQKGSLTQRRSSKAGCLI